MSWDLIGNDKVIKTTELSDFINNGIIVPLELSAFFNGEGQRLAFIYEGREYPAYIETEGGNKKLKWSKVLMRKLTEAFPQYHTWFKDIKDPSQTPRIEFKKSNGQYEVRFILEEIKDLPKENDPEIDARITQKLIRRRLRELLYKWMTGYQNYFPRDFRFSFKDIINEEIPKELEALPVIKAGNYKVQGFAGDSQWAEIPWVAVMDKRLSHNIENGLHLIYLLSMDSHKLYLAIVYAEPSARAKRLSEKVAEFREKIDTGNFKTNQQEVLLANATLVSGMLCYREYSEALPDEETIETEFEAMLQIYDGIIKMTMAPLEAPVPEAIFQEANKESEEEFDIKNDLEFSEPESISVKDQLIGSHTVGEEEMAVVEESESIVEEPEAILEEEKTSNRAELSKKEKPSKNKKTEAKRPIDQSVKETPELDLIKSANEMEKRSSVKKRKRHPLRNETLTSYLKAVLAKMGAKGFYYSPELVKSYYLSLKSKPFVMIRGTVGSGKTSFPRMFASAIGANTENGRYQRVLVKDGWKDEQPLFGYLDSRGHFVPGALMSLLKSSREHPEKPHFFLLDEMDQSPVEKYLHPLLERINGNAEPFLTKEDFGSDLASFREYGGLTFTDNIYIIGTVNGGLGSHSIGPKVLDSGNTIEMPVVDIGVFPDYGSPTLGGDWENNQFKILKKTPELPEIIEKLMLILRKIQQILVEYDQPMGYRGVNEILAFGINSGVEGLFTEQEVIDLAIKQRILPVLEFNCPKDEELLKALGIFCLGDEMKEMCTMDFCIELKALLQAEEICYPRSGQQLFKRLKKLV